jgi:hypothetical protein
MTEVVFSAFSFVQRKKDNSIQVTAPLNPACAFKC